MAVTVRLNHREQRKSKGRLAPARPARCDAKPRNQFPPNNDPGLTNSSFWNGNVRRSQINRLELFRVLNFHLLGQFGETKG